MAHVRWLTAGLRRLFIFLRSQVLTELLEVGDGSFEVRLVGRKAGRYMVAVQCGSQHVVGSPFEAVLQPSRPTAYTCRTSISGVQQVCPYHPTLA